MSEHKRIQEEIVWLTDEFRERLVTFFQRVNHLLEERQQLEKKGKPVDSVVDAEVIISDKGKPEDG